MSDALKPLFRLIGKIPFPKLLMGLAAAFALVETGVGLWVPILVRDLIEAASAGSVPKSLMVVVAVVILGQALISGGTLYLAARAGERVTAYLRNTLVSRLLRMPMSFHDDRQSGELVSRSMSDTTSIQSLLTEHTLALFAGVFSMVGAIAILWFLDWRLTLVLFLTSLVGVILVVPIASRLQAIGVDTQEELAVFSGRLAGVFGDMRLIKSSCAEDQEEAKAGEAVDRLRKLGVKEARILAVLGPLVTLGISGALVVILGYGGTRVAAGTLTVGTLVAFILYLFQVVMPMVQLSTFLAALNKAAGAASHLGDLLEEPVEARTEGGRLSAGAALLHFEGVEFSYGPDRKILTSFDLEIPAGKVTALVGPSGAGKTTVLSLLERLYQPSAGSVTLGGHDIAEFALEPWRRSIGYVSQESPLLAGTVRENLCLGLGIQPDEREIEKALGAARANEFVAVLPEGLDTEVGERGVKLSGGQRQRLAIARAFLCDPAMLMLDEATANLDSESEAAVRAALRDLMKGRTTVVVAHRLSTVVDADQIAVLESGSVTGVGTHRELMLEHDVYRELVEGQRFEIGPAEDAGRLGLDVAATA